MTKNNFERAQALVDGMGHRSIILAILCLRRGAKRKELRKMYRGGEYRAPRAQNCSPLSFPSLVGSCVHRKEKGPGNEMMPVWITCLCFQLVSGLKWSGEDEKMRENFMVGMQITAVWVTCLRFNLSLVGCNK